ncbi:PmoA family protein [Streptomyces sp. NPDC051561]|uniref:PmoA family protein n=1 Tax=Streptomyces sp. NPDC051561 TaxID=3365658 RepID=UPI0037BAC52B
MNTPLTLTCAGRPVASYLPHPTVEPGLSPRPYLHPVTTLGGLRVTEELPEDHRHHLGAGVAVPDVDGRSFWGGSTYVRGEGPRYLDNHGVQTHLGWQRCEPDGFVEELSWRAHAGHDAQELLRERRTVAARPLDATAWALDLSFTLTNTTGRPLSLGSPATNGRPGAGYGGYFWRAPKEATVPDTFTATKHGEDTVHGARADWVALSGEGWTLAFAGGTEETRGDPWFVRTTEYPGVGSSLAWEERVPVAAGESVERRVVTVVADGRLGEEAVAAYVREALAS